MRAVAVAENESMVPDSPESRLARMEERVESNRRQIDTFAPLVRSMERVQWRLDELVEDFKKSEGAQDHRFERFEKQHAENLERLARSFENQITSCSNAVARVAEGQEKAGAVLAELQAESKTAKEAKQSKLQILVARYGLVAVLCGALIASVTSIVITFFGGG